MLNFGISPCPNDTFIFYAMINKKINLRGYEFNFIIEDVEKLNNLCLENKLDISKVSVHAYYYLQNKYDFLNAGGAISEFGPIVVTKDVEKIKNLSKLKIALPGKLTTASALMWFYWKKNYSQKKYSLKFVTFNRIIEMVEKEEVHLGVLIHEGRFVYKNRGLNLLADLGKFWQEETETPIPLGCIIAKKETEKKELIEDIIRESIIYSRNHKDEVLPFVKSYARELDDNVIISHIDTYVNEYSLNMGYKGYESINIFINKLKQEEIWI